MQEKPRGSNLCWACERSPALLRGRLATCVPWREIMNTLYPSNSLSWKFFPRRLWLMPTDVLVQRCSVFVTCKTWEPAWHQQGYTAWKCLLLKANDWEKCSWHNGMRKAQNKKPWIEEIFGSTGEIRRYSKIFKVTISGELSFIFDFILFLTFPNFLQLVYKPYNERKNVEVKVI